MNKYINKLKIENQEYPITSQQIQDSNKLIEGYQIIDTLGDTDDVANYLWGGNWRIPTYTELSDLLGTYTHSWTTVDSVAGLKVSIDDDYLFFPLSGYKQDNNIYNETSYACVWANETDDKSSAYNMCASSTNIGIESTDKRVGQPIRPVSTTKPIGDHPYIYASNLYWAKCNMGATSETEPGDYYAWGELSTKSSYSWNTYKYGDGTDFIKYNEEDELTNLETATKKYVKDIFVDGTSVVTNGIASISNNPAYITKTSSGGYKTPEATDAGEFAFAEGYSTKASGIGSHAEGMNTTASGQSSHAEGVSTIASEYYAHAEGAGAQATGQISHAEGASRASGYASHSEGAGTSTGNYAHAEGEGTTASGEATHAEGVRTNAQSVGAHAEGASTTASGYASHSEGAGAQATGQTSHAEGGNTTASAKYTHAEGEATSASAEAAHAEGMSSSATGAGSHAEGICTQTTNAGEHAQGTYNLSTQNVTDDSGTVTTYGTLHSIGLGTNTARKNTEETLFDGKKYILNVGGYNGTNASEATDVATVINNTLSKTDTDSALSTTSVNPVQNKIVTKALNDKADDDDVVHTTGNETIGGQKTFTEKMYIGAEDTGIRFMHEGAETGYIDQKDGSIYLKDSSSGNGLSLTKSGLSLQNVYGAAAALNLHQSGANLTADGSVYLNGKGGVTLVSDGTMNLDCNDFNIHSKYNRLDIDNADECWQLTGPFKFSGAVLHDSQNISIHNASIVNSYQDAWLIKMDTQRDLNYVKMPFVYTDVIKPLDTTEQFIINGENAKNSELKLASGSNHSITIQPVQKRINLVSPEIRWVQKVEQDDGSYTDVEHLFSDLFDAASVADDMLDSSKEYV